MPYYTDSQWAIEIQDKLAIPQIYSKVWPDSEIQCLDDDPQDKTKLTLDISGADKLIKNKNGVVYFLGQRFRTYDSTLAKNFDDFTLRKERVSGYKSEAYKVKEALENCGLLAAYYAYGHVNTKETGFEKFRIIKFRDFIEKWINDQLKPSGIKQNHDGSSDFYYWGFKKIPNELIYWQLEKTQLDEVPPKLDYWFKPKEESSDV